MNKYSPRFTKFDIPPELGEEEPNYCQMTDEEIVKSCGSDGRRWADAFSQHMDSEPGGMPYPAMHSWFVAAMKAAKSE